MSAITRTNGAEKKNKLTSLAFSPNLVDANRRVRMDITVTHKQIVQNRHHPWVAIIVSA